MALGTRRALGTIVHGSLYVSSGQGAANMPSLSSFFEPYASRSFRLLISSSFLLLLIHLRTYILTNAAIDFLLPPTTVLYVYCVIQSAPSPFYEYQIPRLGFKNGVTGVMSVV